MVTESQLKKQLSSGQISNLYLCFGEEKMLVKRCAQLIENKISGGDLNEFNYHVFDNDADLSDISVCADMIPFMSEWNILRINDMDIDKLAKSDFDALMKIIKNASGQTVIIIAMPTLEVTAKSAKKAHRARQETSQAPSCTLLVSATTALAMFPFVSPPEKSICFIFIGLSLNRLINADYTLPVFGKQA